MRHTLNGNENRLLGWISELMPLIDLNKTFLNIGMHCSIWKYMYIWQMISLPIVWIYFYIDIDTNCHFFNGVIHFRLVSVNLLRSINSLVVCCYYPHLILLLSQITPFAIVNNISLLFTDVCKIRAMRNARSAGDVVRSTFWNDINSTFTNAKNIEFCSATAKHSKQSTILICKLFTVSCIYSVDSLRFE